MVAVPVGRARLGSESRFLALIALTLGLTAAVAVILVAPSDGDPLVFMRIADPIAAGAVAYRDVPVEYPPIALLPIVLPRVVVGVTAPGDLYTFVFGATALATTLFCGVAVSWLAARGWSRENALDAMLLFVAMALALTVCIIWRFDILPAALTALTVVAVAAGRPGWAGLALGLAVATKLYPGFLVPVFLAYYAFSGRYRSAAFFLFGLVVTLAAIMAQVYLVAGADAFSFLTYQRDRGTEIESVVGGLALAADALFGIPARVYFAFGSFEVSSRAVRALAAPDFVLQVALTLALAITGLRAALHDRRVFGAVTRGTLINYIVAALLVVILANKVLSPQYLAWLLPFAALLPGPQALLLVAASVLTTIEYPILFDALRAIDPFPVLVVNVRNAMLFVLFVWILVDSERRLHRGDVRETPDEPRGNTEYQYAYSNTPAP
jgi:hypothetical protein